MPYVRLHGNQIALVHGARDKSSGKVQQRTLFTLYSKREAQAATGDGENAEHARYFRQLLETANPDLKFDWNDLNDQILQKMEALPDIYPLQQERTTNTLRRALDEFAKQIVLADTAYSPAGRMSVNQLSDDLRALMFIIQTRLDDASSRAELNKETASPFDHYDPFCWRSEVLSNEVPPDIEELSIDFYQSHEFDRAKQLLSLLVRCFPNYAEGFNRLGLIELTEGRPQEAVELFKTTVKVGRGRFPRRIPKSQYWQDLETRPYMRGLMNLALALNQAEKYNEALEVCDQLQRECGSKGADAAIAHRAVAFLNLNRWGESYTEACQLLDYVPNEGFIAGYAAFELGHTQDAIELFLYAAANSPHTASMLLDTKVSSPKSHSEVDDYNAGIELCRSLLRYFDQQSAKSKKFFKRLRDHYEVRELLRETLDCTRKHGTGGADAHRKNYDRWRQLKSRNHAKTMALKLNAELFELKGS